MPVSIICRDAIDWLKNHSEHSIANFITGIPDLDELPHLGTVDLYTQFLQQVVGLLCSRLNPKGYLILIQTDRKVNRQWIDKSYRKARERLE